MKSHAVINNVSMTAADKVVYETLHAFASTTGVISPSVAYISFNTALAKATVTRSLQRLEDAQLIIKTKNGNRANSYELNLELLMALGDDYQERLQAAQAKEAEGKEQRSTAYKMGESVRVLKAKAKAAAVETVLRVLSLLGSNFKEGEERLAKWFKTPSQASQNASGEAFSPSAIKSYSETAKPVKATPVKDYEEIGKEEFEDTFVYDDIKEKIKDNPEGW